ncbi:hypothetical protein PR048_008397 [Dryococelus australis]|uniref:Uncharacterized protein n=1 Tax=Dryococelus australis TaxID=614101 RepID=A0ABQ9HX01_9NEOP|nr:hypothetical protein PR048_008397 [Dryococelus australis]
MFTGLRIFGANAVEPQAQDEANQISDNVSEKAKQQYRNLCVDAKSNLKSDFFDKFEANADVGLNEVFSQIMNGKSNYEQLWEVVKLCLILSYGSASVEGGFSINKLLLVENLHGESLIAQRTVYDSIKHNGGIFNVPVDEKKLLSVRAAGKINFSRRVMQRRQEKKKG